LHVALGNDEHWIAIGVEVQDAAHVRVRDEDGVFAEARVRARASLERSVDEERERDGHRLTAGCFTAPRVLKIAALTAAMKLCSFHLMPYTDLPADFAERYPSVWIDVPAELFDPERGHTLYNDFLDQLELADAVGFDGVCVNEHHSNAYGLMPSPNLMAAALARRTADAALIVLGDSLALYNPPIRVAEEIAMLDCISGGRVIAGFPVGTPQDTCFAYGQVPGTLRDKYREAHDLVLRAWTERRPFAFNGRFTQLRHVNIWPRPLQRPHPPVWIPGGGSVETWQWCAERDYVYCYLSYFGYKLGRRTLGGFWNAMRELGKDHNPYRAGFLQFVGVAETRAEALALYREATEYFYGRSLHVSSRWVNPPGYVSEATLRARAESMVGLAAQRASEKRFFNQPIFEEAVAEGYVVLGSPDEVAAELRELALDLNVGHLLLLLQFGNMANDLARYNIRMFAERVAPQLRDLFSSEWANRWWPRSLSADRRRGARGSATGRDASK